MKKYLYTFKYHAEDTTLFQLEQKYVFNQEDTLSRYFHADEIINMEGTCFGEVILEIAKHAPSLAELKEKLKELPVLHDAMLDNLSLGFLPKASYNDIVRILPSMNIHANLINPKNIYLLTRTENNWYLGRVVSSSDKGWPQHRQKPETMSSAIPHILARTIINIFKAVELYTLI